MSLPTDILLNRLVTEINGWRDGYHFRAHFDNDGDGYFDFSYFELLPEGIASLRQVIDSQP